MKASEMPVYCERCGDKLRITKRLPPHKMGFNAYTGEQLYSQTGIMLCCPKFNESIRDCHSAFALISR